MLNEDAAQTAHLHSLSIVLVVDFNKLWILDYAIKGKRKVQGVPQSQAAAHPRHEKEEETYKTKQEQVEQTYEKH